MSLMFYYLDSFTIISVDVYISGSQNTMTARAAFGGKEPATAGSDKEDFMGLSSPKPVIQDNILVMIQKPCLN